MAWRRNRTRRARPWPPTRYKADTIWDLYRAIWRVTARQQLVLIGLSLIVAALAAAPLIFQQLVVNSLVQGGDIDRVVGLCAGLLGVALLSAVLKFALNFRLSVLGEHRPAVARAALRQLRDRCDDGCSRYPKTRHAGDHVVREGRVRRRVCRLSHRLAADADWHPDQRHRLHLCQPTLARRPGARYRGAPRASWSPSRDTSITGCANACSAAPRIGPHFREPSDAGGRRGRGRLSRSLRDEALLPQAVVQVRAQRSASPARSVSSFWAGGWSCTDAATWARSSPA